MKAVTCIQGSPEWYAIRAGKVTASRLCDVLAKIKSGEASARRNYKAEIVAEILTGSPYDDGYINADMKRGTELEPLARAAYEMDRDVMVDQVGFVLHSAISRAGASPDGLVGTDGLLEIKCPKTATHIQYILGEVVPFEYQPQMLWQMDCCERQWCDFVSYDPRMPEHLQLFIKRMMRDNLRIAEMQIEVQKFLAEVDDILARLPHGVVQESMLAQHLRDSLSAAQARNSPKSSGATTTGECAAPAQESPSTVCSAGPSTTNQPELQPEPF